MECRTSVSTAGVEGRRASSFASARGRVLLGARAMGIWSFLFPSDEDRLRRARARMADGRFVEARKDLMHCKLPEAEALYDECSAAIDKGERTTRKKQLVAEGFHG